MEYFDLTVGCLNVNQHSSVSQECNTNFSPASDIPQGSTVIVTFASDSTCSGLFTAIDALPAKTCFAQQEYWCTNTTAYQQSFSDPACKHALNQPIPINLGCDSPIERYCKL